MMIEAAHPRIIVAIIRPLLLRLRLLRSSSGKIAIRTSFRTPDRASMAADDHMLCYSDLILIMTCSCCTSVLTLAAAAPPDAPTTAGRRSESWRSCGPIYNKLSMIAHDRAYSIVAVIESCTCCIAREFSTIALPDDDG
jgi:hypothetical protein